MTFVATNKAPGVYIDEIQVPGPIAGVGTSTAAFVGPAQMGPLLKPTFLTNFQQFQSAFGGYIEDPQRVYATHAVKGFFDEGGSTCYFVRVGTGAQASLTLSDRASTPRPVLVVTALQEGTAGNSITVQVDDASIASTKATRQQVNLTSASGTQATVGSAADAAKFNPGDWVLLEQGANTDRAAVSSINGANINFTTSLTHTYNGGDIRIADLMPGQNRIRLDSVTGIEPGTYVSIAQGGTTETGVVKAVDTVNTSVTLTAALANLYTMKNADPAVNIKTLEFKLTVAGPTTGTEVFDNLSLDPRHSRYFSNLVSSGAVDVELADPPTPSLPAKNLPAVQGATALTGGAADNIANLQTTDYHKGIDTLLKVDDVNILCVPDAVGGGFNAAATQDIQSYMVAHCEKAANRFAVLDPRQGSKPSNGIVTQRNNLTSDRGFAALYYPWIYISNPLGSGRILVPPSGHVAGIYANNDNTRGVFKAPANEPITSALDLEEVLTDDENGPLNEKGIDVIRAFPGQGIRVWGARTIAPSDVTQWRYVNVRRLTSFIEKSLQEGTRFAVFEPNNLTLWQTIKRLVTDFLTRIWAEGGLFGASPDKAFSVRVDEELNPPEIRALGQLIIEVTIYPTTPAEFIVFRIIQEPGGPSVQE
jgi:phage tail sheath protein FI